jgi:threonine dehydratase
MTTLENIQNAEKRMRQYIDHCIIRTPTVYCSVLSSSLQERLGRKVSVYFKCEHLQPVGSFKIRGALNFALCLPLEVRSRGLITHSSGNHGIAVAAVGRLLSVPVVVVVPRDTSAMKVHRIRGYGADVVFSESSLESRKLVTEAVLNERGLTLVPPFDHDWIMNGQGTIGLEIMEDLPNTDAVIAAVGGCGMISGVIRAVKGLKPDIKVFGAEPLAVNDTWASIHAGRRVGPTSPSQNTICEALRVSPPGELCWEIVSKELDGVFLVPDEQTVAAMKYIGENLKQITEPSGACAGALLFSDEFISILRQNNNLCTIVVVICGGNIELSHFADIISG